MSDEATLLVAVKAFRRLDGQALAAADGIVLRGGGVPPGQREEVASLFRKVAAAATDCANAIHPDVRP
jgi:hypothetical protein